MIVALDKEHLKELIAEEMKLHGNNCNLNGIDVSNWDTSAVKDMNAMFFDCPFNGDISNWNVGNVTDMGGIFASSRFTGDISKWDVSQVTNMNYMFYKSLFNGDILDWNISNVTDMKRIFENCPANIPYWANFDSQDDRKKAINSYILSQKLNHNLPKKSLLTTKRKI